MKTIFGILIIVLISFVAINAETQNQDADYPYLVSSSPEVNNNETLLMETLTVAVIGASTEDLFSAFLYLMNQSRNGYVSIEKFETDLLSIHTKASQLESNVSAIVINNNKLSDVKAVLLIAINEIKDSAKNLRHAMENYKENKKEDGDSYLNTAALKLAKAGFLIKKAKMNVASNEDSI
ncbi:MAG: hypothetical protein KBA66_12635 [Leptospiraceae bacterium]|nr:hypothetical protein [Leptospiraceae bacterium]